MESVVLVTEFQEYEKTGGGGGNFNRHMTGVRNFDPKVHKFLRKRYIIIHGSFKIYPKIVTKMQSFIKYVKCDLN